MADKFDRSLYMSFIPEYLRGNEDFLVFLQLAATEFDITFENIEKFTDLINPDKVPMKFIEALGSFTDYKFVEQADDDFNRELLMRMRKVYEDRGTDHAIIMAATHGDNVGWVGGDIFIPGYPISNEKATLIIAQDNIFTHSRSKHSGGDVFQDGITYMPGIIIIELPYINDDIIQKIIETMPAGVRFKFFMNIELGGGTDPDYTGEYGELSVHKFFRVVPLTEEEKAAQNAAINMKITMEPEVKRDDSDLFIHSTGIKKGVHSRGKRSGRMLIMEQNEYTSLLGVSMMAHSFLTQGFLKKNSSSENPEPTNPDDLIIDKQSDSLFRHSTDSAIFSSKTRNSGELILVEDPVEEDTEYILSPTGEKLDIKEKTGSAHIRRDISQFNRDVDIEVIVDYRITAKRSHSSSIRSGRGKMSGIITNEIDNLVRIMEITPQDLLYYTADQVNHLKPSDYRDPFYQSDPEIYREFNLFVKDIFNTYPEFEHERIIEMFVSFYSDDIAIFSVNTEGKRYRSGRILIRNAYEHDSQLAVSMLPICGQLNRVGSDIEPDITVEEKRDPSFRHSVSSAGLSSKARISGEIIPKVPYDPNGDIISFHGEHLDSNSKTGTKHINRGLDFTDDISVDYSTEFVVVAKRGFVSHGARSGRGKLSGPITGEISAFIPATEYLPSDMMYDAYSVKDKKPRDYKDPFHQASVDISVSV